MNGDPKWGAEKMEHLSHSLGLDTAYHTRRVDRSRRNSSLLRYRPMLLLSFHQEAFGQWLYGTPKTCKEGNGNQCVGNNYERLNGNSYQFI